ncbi:MAG: histidine--tRNA ligase [Chlamydiae bacterium]|nr:histidine--tRNA ligase [Chlamydiota bacterium]
MSFQIPKGTFDILPYGTAETWRLSNLWQYVEEVIRKTAVDYGYQEIRTPIYERTELFCRSVGETSDIVTKEMFTFLDKAGRSLSLRPEGTASVMRSFVENHLFNLGSIHKFFYIGPMFRYERPQSGRFRQHHQFGVEAIGIATPEQDAEVIDLLLQVYKRLHIENLKVHLNTVGDMDSRILFRKSLKEYLSPYFADLSQDSQMRFEKNPLRILDSKDPKDQEILKEAPSIHDALTDHSRAHFEKLCQILDALDIPYEIDDRIVRGLDYYNKTVFEVRSEHLGAQSSMGGGGRYDGLIRSFGGPDLPGVGFATGIERVLQVMTAQKVSLPSHKKPFVYFIPLGEEAKEKVFHLATLCRHSGIPSAVELHAQKLQTAIQNALSQEATYCAIVGTHELEKKKMQLKHLATREVQEVHFDELLPTMLKAYVV